MKVKIALLQSSDHGAKNLAHCIERIIEAATAGAQIICTQELFLSHYFCRIQDENSFDLAEEIPGSTTMRLQQIAQEHNIVLIASLFEKAMAGLYYNTTVIIDADGTYLGKYRKNHIPQDPYFEEKFYFAPGDLGYPVWDTAYGKLGVLICWDQWFPEAARMLALQGAEIIFVPTAIGWLADEKNELGEAQLNAWQQVQKGHAVANACYYAAVNRVGREEEIEFWGHSFFCDYYGQIVEDGSDAKEEILMAECDLQALEKHRRIWPFFRDRRIDTYGDLQKRSIEQ